MTHHDTRALRRAACAKRTAFCRKFGFGHNILWANYIRTLAHLRYGR